MYQILHGLCTHVDETPILRFNCNTNRPMHIACDLHSTQYGGTEATSQPAEQYYNKLDVVLHLKRRDIVKHNYKTMIFDKIHVKLKWNTIVNTNIRDINHAVMIPIMLFILQLVWDVNQVFW